MDRKYGIDILRLLGAFAVIGVHVNDLTAKWNSSELRAIVLALTSFAVPSFFMISGYFLNFENSKKAIIKFISMYATALVIYSLIFYSSIEITSLKSFIVYCMSPTQIARHLWFIAAMIVASFFFSLVKEKGQIFALLIFIVGLLWAPLAIISSKAIDILYPQLLAIPLMLSGHYLKKYNIKTNTCIIFVIISTISVAVEALIIQHYTETTSQFYFSTYPYAASIFLLFNNFSNSNNKIISTLASSGRKYSLFIYIYHLMIIGLVPAGIREFNISNSEPLNWLCVTSFIFLSTLLIGIIISKTPFVRTLWGTINGNLLMNLYDSINRRVTKNEAELKNINDGQMK